MFNKKLADKLGEKYNFNIAENTLFNLLLNKVIFSKNIHACVRRINKQLTKDIKDIHLFFDGHVAGIKNLVYKKPVDMATLYLAISSDNYKLRLRALARLREEAFNYKTLERPLNTRRVLMALAKETVKYSKEPLIQMRLVARFYQAMSGRASVVRTLLTELGLPELPELDELKTKNSAVVPLGFDDQVYDNLSSGRKTPAQVVLDAYIKGLAQITLVYDDFAQPRLLREALLAGEILGIAVNLGIEFVAADNQKHFHHVVLFENCSSAEDYGRLLKDEVFNKFQKEIKKSLNLQRKMIKELIRRFNETYLAEINKYLPEKFPFPSLTVSDLSAYARGRKIHHVHLGRFLKDQLAKHYKLLKSQGLHKELKDKKLFKLPWLELRIKYFDPLYSEVLLDLDYAAAENCFETLAGIAVLNSQGLPIVPRIVFARPLLHDLDAAVRHLAKNYQYISAVEIWNNRVTEPSKIEKLKTLNDFREYLNSAKADRSLAEFWQNKFNLSAQELNELSVYYGSNKLYARIVSSSDGYNRLVPGMGFMEKQYIGNYAELKRANSVELLPYFVRSGKEHLASLGFDAVKTDPRFANLVPLGKANSKSDIFAERTELNYSVLKDLPRDLNRDVRDLSKTLFALAASCSIDLLNSIIFHNYQPFGLMLFLAFQAITYFRNFIVDLSAKGGVNPYYWRVSHFDRHNAVSSVFFSFFSIPLLRLCEYYIDIYIIGQNNVEITDSLERFIFFIAQYSNSLNELAVKYKNDLIGIVFKFIRFFPLALVNGVYIWAHNTLRGFKKSVKKKNFLRSFVSWLPSMLLSYPLGGIIPDVLINKISSDSIGAVIEGREKLQAETKLREVVMAPVIENIIKNKRSDQRSEKQRKMDVLDIMYQWRYAPRGVAVLKKLLLGKDYKVNELKPFFDPINKSEEYENFFKVFKDSEELLEKFRDMDAGFDNWISGIRKKIRDQQKKRVTDVWKIS